MPYADTNAMNEHLKAISLQVAPGKHAILVYDGAGWHKSKSLIVPDNITLIHLPPYSPELNPVEQVFQQLRKLKLSNACYESYEEMIEACTEAWMSFVSVKGNITSLCSRDWAKA
jgi:transposase